MEVWDALTNIYETSHALTKMHYNKQLYTLKISEEDILVNYINIFRTLVDNSPNTSIQISDNDSAIVLLGTLPETYEDLVVSISG